LPAGPGLNTSGDTFGGNGGTAGRGGQGGRGGDGGQGGAGAGGTVSLAATRILIDGGTVDVSGGMGAGQSKAADGLFRYRSEWDGGPNSIYAPTATRANPYSSYTPATFPIGAPDTSADIFNIAYGPLLVGGPDMCGLVSSNNLGVTPDVMLGQMLSSALGKPPNAFAVVRRQNPGAAPTPVPLLSFASVAPWPALKPSLAVNRIDPADTVQVTPQPLQVGGYLRNPLFVPGATGPQTLTELNPYNTWQTFTRPGISMVTAVAAPYSNAVAFSALMNDGDPTQDLWLLDTGLLSVGFLPAGAIFPIAAIADRNTNSLAFSTWARAGSPASLNLQVHNVGYSYSRMSSLPGSDVTFSDLAPNQMVPLSVFIEPTTNLGVQPPTTATVMTDAGTVNVGVTPNVIAPILLGSVTDGGNAGPVLANESRTLSFQAQNDYPYSSIIPLSLYELNIVDIWVEGPDFDYFQLTNPAGGPVPLRNGPLGLQTNSLVRQIVFTPNAERVYQATLKVRTDVNRRPGGTGEIYSFPLEGRGVGPGIFIIQSPADAWAKPGETATFSVVAQVFGWDAPLAYQWIRNGESIPNATNAIYTTEVLASSNQIAHVICMLTAGPFSEATDVALLTVIDNSTPYPQAVLADGPLLYYRLEEPRGVRAYDSSGHGLHGIRTENLYVAAGPSLNLGSAAGFRGQIDPSAIAVPELINPATSNSIFERLTIELWVNVRQWNVDSSLNTIFSGDQWALNSFQLHAITPHQIGFGFKQPDFLLSDLHWLTDSSVYTNAVWLHLAVVYDTWEGTFTFYTNGVQAALFGAAVPAYMPASHLGVSLLDAQNVGALDGLIDEVAVYPTALSPDRIAAHYQAAFASQIKYTYEAGIIFFSWEGTGFILQQSTNFADPSSWTDIPFADLSPYARSIQPGQRFFRLRKL
jgi:hypothetical protein